MAEENLPNPDLPVQTDGPNPFPDSSPVIFLGVASGTVEHHPGTPYQSTSLFEVGRVKPHFAFPVTLDNQYWCFLVRADIVAESGAPIQLNVVNSAGAKIANLSINSRYPSKQVQPGSDETASLPEQDSGITFVIDRHQWLLQSVLIKQLVIDSPGEYHVEVEARGITTNLGRIIFVFSPPPKLTPERISAFEADPTSPKAVIVTFGCKFCNSKMYAYAAPNKSQEQEDKGRVFYQELPDQFVCGCGKTNFDLSYMRQGMHGFLSREARAAHSISYVQRYAHSQLSKTASNFISLVKKVPDEPTIQSFLESNKILFARFHPKKLFIKPRILGRFNADFATFDSEGTLCLIEIERPGLRLFKANGHLRADFNHAYEQVQDWLNEVSKYRNAVLEGLGLEPDQVMAIRGCVIAGQGKVENKKHLQRHMSQPRPGIEFLTLDMLGQSLIELAEGLAEAKS